MNSKPKIVCLCGSTRFYDAFQKANFDETMAGRIVLSVGFYPHSSAGSHGEGVGHDSAEKIALDELHKRKIDLADEVFVLNVDGYIGSSTRSEIDYAMRLGKPLRYLESDSVDRLRITMANKVEALLSDLAGEAEEHDIDATDYYETDNEVMIASHSSSADSLRSAIKMVKGHLSEFIAIDRAAQTSALDQNTSAKEERSE